MTRLSDIQLVILSAAAQRADLSVLPLPDSLNLKGGALNKVMDSLRNRGLIRVLGGDGGPERVVITSEGMAAIGVEAEGDEAPAGGTEADTGATSAESDAPRSRPSSPAGVDAAATPAKSKPAKGRGKAKATKAAAAAREPKVAPGGEPTAKPTPRAGTKQALMIDLLKRPEGATVEQIAAAPGTSLAGGRGSRASASRPAEISSSGRT